MFSFLLLFSGFVDFTFTETASHIADKKKNSYIYIVKYVWQEPN